MVEAIKATAGLAMSTFKDEGDDDVDRDDPDVDGPLPDYRPTPDEKRAWMTPVEEVRGNG